MRVHSLIFVFGLAGCFRTPLDVLERGTDAKTDAALDRFFDLATDRPPDRPLDRSPDRSPDRPLDTIPDRSPDRPLDRSPDRSPDRPLDRSPDRSPDRPLDTSPDRSPDRPLDTTPDRSPDRPFDTSPDLLVDTSPDRLPDLLPDTRPDLLPDLVEVPSYKGDCTDPSVQFIYVVTMDYGLYAFRPQSLSWEFRGTLNCPSESTPFSMAVNRAGIAYVHYHSGDIFKVSTANATCEATLFSSSYGNHGMGFATDALGPEERLYLSSTLDTPPELRVLDLTFYLPLYVGPLSIGGMELTGTGDGRLYAFYDDGGPTDDGVAHLVELNKANGTSLSDITLPTIRAGSGWALSFWGGDFYFFTAPSGQSIVTRYSPSTGIVEQVSALPNKLIVGAGASTCAPEH